MRLLALLVRHLVLEGSGSELILLHILHTLSIHLHRLAWVRTTLHLLLSMSRLLLLLMLLLLESKLLSHDSLSLRVLLSRTHSSSPQLVKLLGVEIHLGHVHGHATLRHVGLESLLSHQVSGLLLVLEELLLAHRSDRLRVTEVL